MSLPAPRENAIGEHCALNGRTDMRPNRSATVYANYYWAAFVSAAAAPAASLFSAAAMARRSLALVAQ